MAKLPPPPDRRPYVPGYTPGHEIRTLSPDGATAHCWRQVGWHGQTGAIYGLGENPADHEPGGFSPLYVMIESLYVMIESGRLAPPDDDTPAHLG